MISIRHNVQAVEKFLPVWLSSGFPSGSHDGKDRERGRKWECGSALTPRLFTVAFPGADADCGDGHG
jgi:hypothetical protein